MQSFSGEIYGTTFSIKIAENRSYEYLQYDIKKELDRIDLVFSTYKPASEISKINSDQNIIWSDEFSKLHKKSEKIKELSDGAFKPEDDNGYDFSGIAKGYAIDMVAAVLENNGISNYFVEIGGEIRAKGTKFEQNWIFGIERPIEKKKSPYIAFKLPSNGISIATSGEYRESNHIWGEGPRDLISVTVATEDAASADAWATALYVLGLKKGIKIAEENDLAVYFISSDGDSVKSKNWSMISP